MNSDIAGNRRGATSHEGKVPLDVRIVTYYLYAAGFVFLAVGLLTGIGLAAPEPHRALFGSVLIASRLADSVDKFVSGICFVFCAWGLMRRMRLAWWFSLILFVYCLTFVVLLFPEYRVDVRSVAIGGALIAWLWFRRELYGVHAKRL